MKKVLFLLGISSILSPALLFAGALEVDVYGRKVEENRDIINIPVQEAKIVAELTARLVKEGDIERYFLIQTVNQDPKQLEKLGKDYGRAFCVEPNPEKSTFKALKAKYQAIKAGKNVTYTLTEKDRCD